ncbi:hypothetical protein FANTH_14063 [Fusarium anthophilum]|uniref:Carrier domain-containing protein n=1 Tax=Fusarium anthophilum TaxID=48485 RepID=A0A8H4YL36_9HYPO|nr:hypothetical protein FANTH_14063 [Fusarium anthophilum]
MGIINNNKDLLDRESATLAEKLRTYGAGRDDLVGVLMGRTADYVIAALAALRAGGAFLVLEVAYPARLLQDVIEDAKPVAIVTQAKYKKNLAYHSPVVVVDSPENMTKGESLPQPRQQRALPEDDDVERLMFVSYSSGTTGKPKGIMNPHRAAIRSYGLRFAVSDLKPGDRVACNVFFIWEMFRPLIRGATTVAIPDYASYDPVTLVELLSSWRITDTLMTPTLLIIILSRYPKLGERLPHLRSLRLNGEVVTTDLVRRAMDALPETRLLNVYSACETHEAAVGDIRQFVDFDTRVCPIGFPTDPDHTYVLDEAGNAVKQGVEGELYVGGKLLARGYLNLPETAIESFQRDPFATSKDARMYRTGDLARFLPSGLLEVTGRVGGMIKARGYTVHPSTVECAILKHLAVRGCSVMAHGEDLERRIVAYIVPEKFDARDRTIPVIDEYGHSPTARKALTNCLAQYMIPSVWISLPELPTNGVSGKVDLKALPAPPSPRSPIPRVVTESKQQNFEVDRDTVIKLWAASLNMLPKVITPEHDFFDLGGHSLALADLAGRLSNTFGFPVPLSPLAESPSLYGHIKAIKDARDGHTASVEADLPVVLRTDSVLPDDIKGAHSPPRSLRNADTILLTGATGYFGEDFVSAGLARIRENCINLGIWEDYLLERIEILPATLNKERLGLYATLFDSLAARVQIIFHAAAAVNLIYPYAALRMPNVVGTREIIRLAGQSGATLHYISINGVFPASLEGWAEDFTIDMDDVPSKLSNGYGQTKWVAERLVDEASHRGIPVRIYRPGTITGHSISGSTNVWDLINALLVESLQLGMAPDDQNWHVEITPVDFVSNAIVTLADHVNEVEQMVYHLGDSAPVHSRDLLASLAKMADILRRGMPSAEVLSSVVVLRDEKTQSILAKYNIARPELNDDLLRVYVRHFHARGWLQRPPRREKVLAATRMGPKGCLSGKISVVTGASSGIGPVDILVNCAGVMYFTMMVNSYTDQWEQTVDVNCKGLLHCLSSTVPGMLSRKSGHIVAISSDAGRKVFLGLGALRLETAGYGLRVTAIQPGNVSTDLYRIWTDREALKKFGEPTGSTILRPEDVAKAVAYAVSQPSHVAINEHNSIDAMATIPANQTVVSKDRTSPTAQAYIHNIRITLSAITYTSQSQIMKQDSFEDQDLVKANLQSVTRAHFECKDFPVIICANLALFACPALKTTVHDLGARHEPKLLRELAVVKVEKQELIVVQCQLNKTDPV